eukprot:6179974-Prymnesium_polylepis.1
MRLFKVLRNPPLNSRISCCSNSKSRTGPLSPLAAAGPPRCSAVGFCRRADCGRAPRTLRLRALQHVEQLRLLRRVADRHARRRAVVGR